MFPRKSFFLCIPLIILNGCASTENAPIPKPTGFNEDRVKTLVVDISETIILDFNATPVVGSKDILDVQPSGLSQQFKLHGLKVGSSSLVFMKEDGQVARRMMFNVISDEMANAVVNVRGMLRGVEGAIVKAVDEKVVIEGELLHPKDFDKILAVQQAYGNNLILILATINKKIYDDAAQKMQSEIRSSRRGADISVKYINGTYILDGEVDDYNDKQRAESIVQAFVPEALSSHALSSGLITQGGMKSTIRNVIVIRKKSGK